MVSNFCAICLSDPCSCVEIDDLEKLLKNTDVNDMSKLESIIATLPDEMIDEVFEIVNSIRLEQAKNPLLKFKTDRKEQMEFIGDEYKINIALAGNQFGKSFAMAYKIAAIATGQSPKSRHQPDNTRPLEIVVIGPSWSKIAETIQKDLMSLLREDQYDKKSNGTYYNKFIIKAPNGGETKVLFMPSSTDKKQDSQEFEGSRYHYAFIDEGITPELFRKILVRVGSQKGYFYQAFTRLPETMHLAHHLIDLEKGQGDFKYLIDLGLVNIIRASTLQNKYLDAEEKQSMMIGAGTGEDLDLFKKYEPLMYEDDLESLKAKEFILSKMTSTFKARILGIVDRPSGSVFNFREQVHGRDYNMFTFKEFTTVLLNEQGRWDILHDYGQSAPATWILTFTSNKTGTTYQVDEVYRRNMSIEESAQECCAMMKRWHVYGKINSIFADKQIRDTGRKDKRTDSQLTIEMQYKSKYDIDGDPCFPNNITWICKQSDKNNKTHTMSVLSEMIEEENPLTPCLPYMRFSYKVPNTIKEYKMLRYATKIHKQSGASYEDVDGDDHAIDPCRYMINSKVNIVIWAARHKKRIEFNEMAYGVNASGNPLFQF
mgnify:FL=1|tara:strand:+ start:1653 stop:3449 length:1797 start_codon:yes stop_codon:yes gene_type:complete